MSREEELRDMAYHIATGQHLIESFGYEEFQRISTLEYVWQPFEDWCEKDLAEHIASIAEEIYANLLKVENKKSDSIIDYDNLREDVITELLDYGQCGDIGMTRKEIDENLSGEDIEYIVEDMYDSQVATTNTIGANVVDRYEKQ